MKLGAALLLCALAVTARAAPPQPQGYRMDRYREAVPDGLDGARTLHTAELARFITLAHPVLIDVLPAPPVPPDARPGLPRLPLPQRGIPGTIWLPDTGRGALAPGMEARFRQRLAALLGGHPDKPVVFYCLSQCWMSWNAARRALSYSITNVVWYPDGVDGWQAAGLPTAEITPDADFRAVTPKD